MAEPQDVNVVSFLGETGIDAMGTKFREGWESKKQVDDAMRQFQTALKPVLADIKKTFDDIGDKLVADLKSVIDSSGSAVSSGSSRSSSGTKHSGTSLSKVKVEKTKMAGTEAAASQAEDAVTSGGGALKKLTGLLGGGGGGLGGIGKFMKTPMAGLAMGAVNAGINAANARFDRGREGVLSADRMSVLYQQMTGLSQLDVSAKYRMPLTNYRLGAGGINDIMALEAQTGIKGIPQASSIEAMRTLSGYSMSTGEVAGQIANLASAPTANRMFMMTGMGLIGPGGKQNTTMDVMKNLVRVAGLTSKEVIDSAMLPGSITRAKLTSMGVPQEMQTQVIQYAKSNLTYKEKGGAGMYDPSRKADRRLMGIEENFATQVEETQRLETKRDEKFYRRQVDNFAYLERQTQSLTRVFGALEDKLSGILGFTASNRIATSLIQGIPGFGGDPDSSGFKGFSASSFLKGGDPDNVKAAKNNKTFQSMNPKMQERVLKLLSDNKNVKFGGGTRSADEQRRMFLSRYRKTNSPTNSAGKKNIQWEGSYWEHVTGWPAAPPGYSMHEIGLAADLDGDLEWVKNNSAKYGLRNFADVNGEAHHIQPAELPGSRAAYEKAGAQWGHGPAGAAAFNPNSDFGEGLDHSSPTDKGSGSVVSGAGFRPTFGGSISERVSASLSSITSSGSGGTNSGKGGSPRRAGISLSPTGTSIINNSISNFKHGGMARSGVDITRWASDFLGLVGAPVTLANMEAISAWIAAEGTRAKFNPLAVVSKPTASAMGGTANLEGWTDFNSVGVKNFANYEQGLKMNAYHVKTYGKRVVKSLQSATNDPYEVIASIEKMVQKWAPDYAARDVLESRGVTATSPASTNNSSTPSAATLPTGGDGISVMPGPGGGGNTSMSVIGGHTFNINPTINMVSNGSGQDMRRLAKELAVMVRRELELEMLRSS